MVRVAIIIVTWNSSHLIEKVLITITRQNLSPVRVLLIDNGSNDVEALTKVVDKFSDYELIRLNQNIGFAAANNLGIKLCDNTDFVLLLNPDAFLEPDFLNELVDGANRHPNVAAFGGLLLNYSDPSIIDGVGDYLNIAGKPGRIGHGYKVDRAILAEKEIFSPCAAAALYRRDALVAVSGFDEDFFCYIEDVDLSFRLRLVGYRCLLLPKAIAHHIGSATTGGRHSDFAVYHGHRNLVWAFIKNMPGILLWILLPLHLMMNLVAIFWFAFRGQGKVILRSKLDAIKGIPKMWRKRAKIQEKRVVSVNEIWRHLDKKLFSLRWFQ